MDWQIISVIILGIMYLVSRLEIIIERRHNRSLSDFLKDALDGWKEGNDYCRKMNQLNAKLQDINCNLSANYLHLLFHQFLEETGATPIVTINQESREIRIKIGDDRGYVDVSWSDISECPEEAFRKAVQRWKEQVGEE